MKCKKHPKYRGVFEPRCNCKDCHRVYKNRNKMKYHLYLNGADLSKDDYGVTACGRKGQDVGGLIEYFFKMISSKQRCKTCDKIHKNRNKK